MEGNFKIVAKSLYGLEDILAEEIRMLGGRDIQILNRAVSYTGDKALLYKSNLYLRTAIRILLPVLNTQIKNQVDLYARIREYEWEKHLKPGMTLAVDTFLDTSEFTNSHFVSLRCKDAIVDRMRDLTNRRPSVSTTNPDLRVNIHLSHNKLDVSIDTSGQSLHKRGYRRTDTGAPLSEVLAAGLLLLAGWKGQDDFYDPMCGSGTLGIEAALIARNIPPGIFRKQFAFENSPDFDADLWEDIFDNIEEKPWDGQIISSDLSKNAIRVAHDNAKRAAVHKSIIYKGIDFRMYPEIENGGLAILNPPYGERLATNELNDLYRAIGDTLKNSFAGTQVWIISSQMEALKHIGLHPTKKIKLFNGALECKYQGYEIYKGSRKSKYQKENGTKK